MGWEGIRTAGESGGGGGGGGGGEGGTRRRRRAARPVRMSAPKAGSGHLLMVSMASVPTRFDALPATLARLEHQTRVPDAVVLVTARRYKNFPLSDGALDNVRRVAQTSPLSVTVHELLEDVGPMSKIIGAMLHLRTLPRQMSDRTVLVTLDDDLDYPRWACANLLHWSLRYPDAVVAHAGGMYHGVHGARGRQNFTIYGARWPGYGPHRAGQPWLSPPCTVRAVNALYGWAGVAYRPYQLRHGLVDRLRWLTDEMPRGCWYCDDMYVSGHLHGWGVPILLVPFPLADSRWAQLQQGSAARPHKPPNNSGPGWQSILGEIRTLLLRFNESTWQGPRHVPPSPASCAPSESAADESGGAT